MRSDVSFDSGGLTLAAHLYTPDGDEAMPDLGARGRAKQQWRQGVQTSGL